MYCSRSGIKCDHAKYSDSSKMKILCNISSDGICACTRYCRTTSKVVFADGAKHCLIRSKHKE